MHARLLAMCKDKAFHQCRLAGAGFPGNRQKPTVALLGLFKRLLEAPQLNFAFQ
jgi:hypothetical protein